MDLTREIVEQLSVRFPPGEEKQREGAGKRTLTYIDARAVMDRLDEVVGPENWCADFLPLFPVSSEERPIIKCLLTVCGVTKADVGEAGKEDEIYKSACSDALKRAAVHFGVGRYLYGMKGGTPAAPSQARPPAQSRGEPAMLATEPQIKAMYAIARTSHALDDEDLDARCQERYGCAPQELTRRQASEFIDALKLSATSQEQAAPRQYLNQPGPSRAQAIAPTREPVAAGTIGGGQRQATLPQHTLIKRIAHEKDLSDTELDDLCQTVAGAALVELTITAASQLIDYMREMQ